MMVFLYMLLLYIRWYDILVIRQIWRVLRCSVRSCLGILAVHHHLHLLCLHYLHVLYHLHFQGPDTMFIQFLVNQLATKYVNGISCLTSIKSRHASCWFICLWHIIVFPLLQILRLLEKFYC